MLASLLAGLVLTAAPTPACTSWLRESSPLSDAAGPTREQRRQLLAQGGSVKAVETSYVALWLPEAFWRAPRAHVLVALHGSHGAPEAEWNDWRDHLAARGWGFLGLAWYDPARDRYDDDVTVERRLAAAIDALQGSCGLGNAAFHLLGFSAGGALAYPVTYRDLHGQRLFTGTVANAGAWAPGGPLYPTLADVDRRGEADAFVGAAFWMYCGELDRDPGWPMCDNMEQARVFLLQHGAQVASLVRNTTGEHRSLPFTPEAVRAMFAFLDARSAAH